MKKLISLFLLLAMLVLSLASCGSTEGSDDKQTLGSSYSKGLAYEVSASNAAECVITGIGSCTDKNIVIPSYINGMRVVGIAEGAFSPKSELTAAVRTPVTVTAIGSKSTKGTSRAAGNGILSLSGFTYAPVGGNLVSGSPFYEVENGGNLGEGYETGTGTPIDLEEIESVVIPLSVRDIGDEAFYGCEDLAAINTHANLSAIGKDAFKETAYYNSEANWEGKALYLGNYLLNVSGDVSGEFTVKEGTTMIASYAFYQCDSLTSVYFASDITTVGSYAFYGCTNLIYVEPGDTKVTYGTGAFEGSAYYYYYAGNFSGGILSGEIKYPITPGGTPAVTEKYPTQFEEIDEGIFENVKKNPQDHYTYEERFKDKNNILMTNGIEYYYTSKGEDFWKEYFATTDENGIVMYRLLEDVLYFTNETMPTVQWIPEELNFEDLTLVPEKGNLYCYDPTGNGSSMIEFGFKNKTLSYIGIITPEETVEIYYYDIDRTVVPAIPLDMLSGDAILDENGNKR